MVNPPVLTGADLRCIYCQAREADTEDHVPPKLWVPPALRSDILRVPSCLSCNQSFQQDDEYVRAKLLLRPEAGSHPASRPLMDSFVRGAWRPESRGFKESLIESVRSVSALTPAGLYAGRVTMFEVDGERVRRSMARIVRGLYYHETGTPLPVAALVTVAVTFEQNPAQQATVQRYLRGQKQKGIGGNTLGYVWRPSRESPENGIWVLVLYGMVPFCATTLGPEAARGVLLGSGRVA